MGCSPNDRWRFSVPQTGADPAADCGYYLRLESECLRDRKECNGKYPKGKRNTRFSLYSGCHSPVYYSSGTDLFDVPSIIFGEAEKINIKVMYDTISLINRLRPGPSAVRPAVYVKILLYISPILENYISDKEVKIKKKDEKNAQLLFLKYPGIYLYSFLIND